MDKCITHQFIFKHTTNNDTGKESYFINGTPVSHNGFYDNQTKLTNKDSEIVGQEVFDRVENSIPFFKRLGGKESFKFMGGYVWKSVSISPNNSLKTVRLFKEIRN